ncbi:Glucose 1-dehydrogenase 2 [Baekduia alba]|uniref:SDR family NAD(P)-dependent oxidoreductase n=1 Tax=Baekduia alba TaxID=2997333 RepID=UPI002340CC5E|nr:SDR family NAD(P)-dependent oxidoreductase [Baekduia alba]WCB95388.1 Glucose 1-dehydrogenase 2 [Baekduia alba]
MAGAIVIGAGPGIGASVARRFAREGLPVALLARSAATLEASARTVVDAGGTALSLVADSTDDEGLRAALAQAVERHGVPEVLVYNAAQIRSDQPGDLTVDEHRDAWAVNVAGAVTAVAAVAPAMADAGAGTVLLTGGMPEPLFDLVSLSLGKAGIRALAQLLDAHYGERGLHVATVTVCGPVEPGGPFDPDEIADAYWRLHRQPREAWERELVYRGRA